MNYLWILETHWKRIKRNIRHYPYPAHRREIAVGRPSCSAAWAIGATSKAALRGCAFAQGRRIRPKPFPLKRTGPAHRVADERGSVLRPSPTSRSNRAEAGEARPSGRRCFPGRHGPPLVVPGTPADSARRGAPVHVLHAHGGAREEEELRVWRTGVLVRMIWTL